MVDEVAQIWASVLGRTVGPDTHLFDDLGAESVQILEILDIMSEEFGAFLRVEQLYANPTPRAAAAILQAVGADVT